MSEMKNKIIATSPLNSTIPTAENINCNLEQPQTKRKKIEKIKSVTNSRISITNTTPLEVISIVEVNESAKKHFSCSSNPADSYTTSLSEMVNVRDISSIQSTKEATESSGTNISRNCGEQTFDMADRVSQHAMTETLTMNNTELVAATSTTSSKSLHHGPFFVNNAIGIMDTNYINEMREFEESLSRQCLCGISERTLRKPFQSPYWQDVNDVKRIANLSEWPINKLLQFLSNLQLLFAIYLKQNSKGLICARIMDVCDALIRDDQNLIDELIVLAGFNNSFVKFLTGRVLASFLVIAKQNMNDNWLKKLVEYLFSFTHLDHMAVQRIHFSLQIIKQIVEWKDVDLHPLDYEIEPETETYGNAGVSIAVGQAHVEVEESPLGTHTYLHFQTQQTSLETNYFAVQFRSHSRDQRGNYDDLESEESNGIHIQDTRGNSNIQQLVTNPHYPFLPGSSRVSNHHLENSNMSSLVQNENESRYFQQVHYNSILRFTNTSSPYITGCHTITLTDSESHDTAHLKYFTIKTLENKWQALVKSMAALIANHLNIENAENCVLNFLQLWENIISVKTNLSIVETLPFYAQLDKFEMLLNQNLTCIVYKQILCLLNEALCYGSTLALQDMLPDDTCFLAHQIVRHVKDFSILESLPRRQPENIVSIIGFKRKPVVYSEIGMFQCCTQQSPSQLIGDEAIEMDKTILQKMVLLVLKSIAVIVKEIRSDSSDSSIDSSDYDVFQDMVLIERSIRDVLHKLEAFIKNTLEFHPECHFSKILIHLFDDQDDHLIEAMVCTLDVTAGISFRNNAFTELTSMLNPVFTFLEFLKMISNSSDILLDLLVSNETCFLLYLLRFLKYIRMNWATFVQSCHNFGLNGSTIEEAMSVLIRLRLQISRLVSRQLYPYDISPVLRLLESCESLYEGNELS